MGHPGRVAATGEGADDFDTPVETLTRVVGADGHGERVDRLLALWVPALSRAYFQTLIESGGVRLNGAVLAKPARKVKVGEQLVVELRPTAQAQAFAPEALALDVVHEDADLMVLNKPAGLVVHPGAGHWSGTLLNGLLAHHTGAAALPRAGIVHRLDKDTSGLMVVAKSAVAYDALVRQIAERSVSRVYVALAHGVWRGPSELDVERAVGRDPQNRLRMAALAPGAPGAKPAKTTLRLLSGASEAGGCCWVGCKLHTGRTHQIRVHMASLGHPLVGDATYGGRPLAGLARQGLHAHRLALAHPVSGRPLGFECPWPADMVKALETLGLDYNTAALWPLASG
ncbi:MAG: hypothetical protein RJA09_1259 [Pseudomonadota bacterium]